MQKFSQNSAPKLLISENNTFKGTLLPVQNFQSLKSFVEHCNNACKELFAQKSTFCLPVKRKFVLSLEEMAIFSVCTHFSNSIDKLKLPKGLKKTFVLANHNHFEIILDEKEANKQVTRKCHIRCQSVENFYFIMEHQNVTEWVVKKLIHTDTIERTGLSMIPYEIRILMSQFRQ